MKMWAGRFSKEVDDRVNDFNSSIRFDCRMYEQDIKGSLAHAAMLAAQGIIPQEDADAIAQGLEGILADLKSGALVFDPGAEDIHMFVEAELTKRIAARQAPAHRAQPQRPGRARPAADAAGGGKGDQSPAARAHFGAA